MNLLHSEPSYRLCRLRHLLAAALLVLVASQTLAQQHFHSADDLNSCVICAHGDHSPAADSAAAKTPTVKHPHTWNISFQTCIQSSDHWPAFQSRAPPSP
ncbi:MAG: hypothetical protein NXH95_09570 [Pseudomonadaceae bacterium]|nr:hypothetical protein [Pseudomonadaceae bacterium]